MPSLIHNEVYTSQRGDNVHVLWTSALLTGKKPIARALSTLLLDVKKKKGVKGLVLPRKFTSDRIEAMASYSDISSRAFSKELPPKEVSCLIHQILSPGIPTIFEIYVTNTLRGTDQEILFSTFYRGSSVYIGKKIFVEITG